MTVNKILARKGAEVFSVLPTITVYEALVIMSQKNIGAILVMENNQLKGIFSERDYARKIVLKDKSSKETLVQEIMATEVITIKPTDVLDFCMELMYNKKIRHLPVVENDVVTGVVSIGDVVKAMIDVQKETIQHLNSYISGQ